VKVSLLEAWGRWGDGKSLVGDQLWGVKILWWGRIGKGAEFLAAMTIIADVIGPDRIRRFGAGLKRGFDISRAAGIVRSSTLWFRAMVQFLVAKSDSEAEKKALEESNRYGADNLNYLVTIAIAVAVGFWLAESIATTSAVVAAAFIGFLASISVAPCITLILILTLMFLGALIDTVLIDPLAWVLDRSALDRWIKVGSVLLLIAGFHFDLLSS
jgi:hypothetical protein